jgi:predicted dinucleotide-binding enzyme
MLGTLDPNKPEVQHVVTAFNSVGAARMVNPQFRQGPPTMFLCGDSAPYRAQVSRTHAFKLLVE